MLIKNYDMDKVLFFLMGFFDVIVNLESFGRFLL